MISIADLISTINNNDKNIIIKKYGDFHLVCYNKKQIGLEEEEFPAYYRPLRSLVCRNLPEVPDEESIEDSRSPTIYSISPSKSIDYRVFIQRYPNVDTNIIVEDFIEGTMINVYWNDEKWEISTKTTIGGNSTFFGNKTFKTMFDEAASVTNFNIDLLDKSVSYSFVLQHPENRIVTAFYKPALWLIEAYHISPDTIYPLDTQSIIRSDPAFTYSQIRTPQIYSIQSATHEQLYTYFTDESTPYNIMGVVIRNIITNERTKIRNPNYESVRQLRGNQPKLQYHYFVLLKEHRVREFLKYYPEYKEQFRSFEAEKDAYIRSLFHHYKSCYIRKEGPLNNYPTNYKTHMYKIHEIFKNVLRPHEKYVTIDDVINYFNQLQPPLQLWSINYK